MLNAQVAQGDWIAYAIRQRTTDALVGTTSAAGRHCQAGRVRDSVLCAVTDLDWPDVRSRLQRRPGEARAPAARPA